MKEEGWPQQEIAAALGVSEGAVSHWVKRGREGGEEALEAHPPKGVSPRLTVEQKAQIPEFLAKGAEAYGFRGDVWTASRVAEVIKRTFGIRYHRDHVGKLMREAGWSRQKPVERASQRNEEALKQWSDERWPQMKKSPRGKSHPRLGRRSGLLSAADGGTHLGPTWANTVAARQTDAGSPFGDQWHPLGWTLVHASTSCLL